MANHNQDTSAGSELLNPSTDNPAHGNGALVAAQPVPPPMFPGLGAQGPEILHGGINQTWLFNCLRRRWLLATGMGLLIGGLTALLLLWCFPESSSTVAYIEVKPKADSEVLNDRGSRMTQIEIEGQKFKHLTLVKTLSVLNQALKGREDIAQLEAVLKEDDPSLWMIEELLVSFPAEGDFMEIRYEGDEDPEEMRQIVQAIVDSYILEAQTEENKRKREMLVELRRKHDAIKGELREKARRLDIDRNAADNMHSPGAEMESQKLQQEIARLDIQIIEANKELIEVEVAARVAHQEVTSGAMIDQMVMAELDQDPALALYQQQLFEIEMQINNLQASSRNQNSSALQSARASRQYVQQQMDQRRIDLTEQLKQKYKNMPNDTLKSVMVEKNIRQAAALEQIKAFQEQRAEKEARLEQLSETDPEIAWRETEVENDQLRIAELTSKIESLEVQEVAGDRVRVAQPAITMEKINTIERFAIASVGGLAAMLATCYAVALIEFRRRRLNGPRDVDEGLSVRVLGVLPSTTARKSLAGGSLAAAQVSEAIDNVRAAMMHNGNGSSKRRQVVLVASPATMEGSTTVACNLAISLARTGRRTLLVDGDLRAPALHKLFGLPLDDGLCEVLRSEVDVIDAVQASTTEGLYVLTAGACDMVAIHALATDQPEPIFEKLRAEFDYVIIDGAPIMSLADSLSIGQYVDGAILTVLRDHSEIRQVYQSIEKMKDLGIDVIGSVVNGVPVKADRRVAHMHRVAVARTKQLPPAAATVAESNGDE